MAKATSAKIVLCAVLALSCAACVRGGTIVASSLADTVQAYACGAATGAERSGAKITSTKLEITSAMAFDTKLGVTVPIAVPVGLEGSTGSSRTARITLQMDLENVHCDALALVPVRTYEIDLKSLHILRRLQD